MRSFSTVFLVCLVVIFVVDLAGIVVPVEVGMVTGLDGGLGCTSEVPVFFSVPAVAVRKVLPVSVRFGLDRDLSGGLASPPDGVDGGDLCTLGMSKEGELMEVQLPFVKVNVVNELRSTECVRLLN